MSAKSEQSTEAFRKWKTDIEARCADHIARYPEYKPIKNSTNTKPIKSNRQIEVDESMVNPGVWLVTEAGRVLETFHGPLAHMKATKFAGQLLNEGPEFV